jgi:hypothetical protein
MLILKQRTLRRINEYIFTNAERQAVLEEMKVAFSIVLAPLSACDASVSNDIMKAGRRIVAYFPRDFENKVNSRATSQTFLRGYAGSVNIGWALRR